MKIKTSYLFGGINVVSLLLILCIVFIPDNIIRIILGLPFLLFSPGYALTIALFPKNGQLSGVERAAYSIGFSVALVILTGLVLNFTSWGIRLFPTIIVISCITLICSLIGWLRQRRLAEEAKYVISISNNLAGWKKNNATSKVLYIILSVVILGTLGYTAFGIANPRFSQTFTEFYLLGDSGKAADYVRQTHQNSNIEVIVGIVNHEQAEVSYRLEVIFDGAIISNISPIVLEDEQKLEIPVSFKVEEIGENQKVELYLHLGDNTQPDLGPLRLWLDVVD